MCRIRLVTVLIVFSTRMTSRTPRPFHTSLLADWSHGCRSIEHVSRKLKFFLVEVMPIPHLGSQVHPILKKRLPQNKIASSSRFIITLSYKLYIIESWFYPSYLFWIWLVKIPLLWTRLVFKWSNIRLCLVLVSTQLQDINLLEIFLNHLIKPSQFISLTRVCWVQDKKF